MIMRGAWYSATLEAATEGDRWKLLDRPWTEYSESAEAVVDKALVGYDLADEAFRWRMRVYRGYNQFDDLVMERTG